MTFCAKRVLDDVHAYCLNVCIYLYRIYRRRTPVVEFATNEKMENEKIDIWQQQFTPYSTGIIKVPMSTSISGLVLTKFMFKVFKYFENGLVLSSNVSNKMNTNIQDRPKVFKFIKMECKN